MKKILTIAVASIAVAAIADPFSPEIGVTTLSLTQKNNIVPVQFTSLGNGGPVSAGEIVCTNNIPLTSHLYVYDAESGYTVWELQQSGWVGLDVMADTTMDGLPIPSGDADSKTIAAGSAIWLSFPESSKPTSGSPVLVSVYGKVATSTNVTIVAGKSNLLCNPTASAKSLDAVLSGKTLSNGDTIQLIEETFSANYVYLSTASSWYKIEPGKAPAKVDSLPALGQYQGVWYKSNGSSNIEITW